MADDRRSGLISRAAALAASVVAVAACAGPGGDVAAGGPPLARESARHLDASVPADTTVSPPPAEAPQVEVTTTQAPATTTTAAPRQRVVSEQDWTPFAVVEGLVLHHPSRRVETVGFHEANHDGARNLDPLPSAVVPVTLETRERGTGPRTAADVVVDPGSEIRAPVTGRVLRAGSYVLYCDNRDDYAVIEPDQRPGWEVKVLHITGVLVRPGDRVVAGQTVLAPGPTQLPFASQIDELTAQPAWPHVHLEVVDPSIPDRPAPGGGSSC